MTVSAAQLIATYGGKDQTIQILMQQVLELRQENERLSKSDTALTKLNQQLHKLEQKLEDKRAQLDRYRKKLDETYSQLDRAKEALVSKSRKIEKQEKKLIQYAEEIDDLYRENEELTNKYAEDFINRDRELAVNSLYDMHSNTSR